MIQDVGRGGRKILDIAKRNEAIDLMWIRQYLNMGPDRPKWAYMMDEIFRMERPKRARETYQMIESWNPLIQDWKPKARSQSVPRRVQNALRPARKHGVELGALGLSNETRREMPVWLHRKASKNAARLYSTEGAKCLKSRHRTHYMWQLVELIGSVPDVHRGTNFCACELCRKASELGCTHPHRCLETAKTLIDALAPKWRPGSERVLVRSNARATATAGERASDGIVVNTTREVMDLRDSIRIFTERESLLDVSALRTLTDEMQVNVELTVYTDGSCTGNGTEDARAGSGVWYGPHDPRNEAIQVPGERQSNQVGELLAVLHMVRTAPGNQPLRIRSDSRFAIDGLTLYVQDWEAKDWMGVKHGPLFRCTMAWMSVETGRRPGLTGCHMSHQRRHHICLDMGRSNTCITLMAEP